MNNVESDGQKGNTAENTPKCVGPTTPLQSEEQSKLEAPKSYDPNSGQTNVLKRILHWCAVKERKTGLHDWIMVAFTGVLTLVAIGQATIAWQNSKSGTEQMGRVIDAANRIDDAADSFSRSAAAINGGIASAVQKLQTQTEKMDSARTSTEENSKKSLQATIDTFHQEQRAWLGITGVAMNNDHIVARITNTGRVAANFRANVDLIVANFVLTKDTPFEAAEHTVGFGGGGTSIPPGGYYDIAFPISLISEKDRISIEKNLRLIYFRGDATYQTGFGKNDVLRFCFAWTHQNPVFQSCPLLRGEGLEKANKEDEDRNHHQIKIVP